MNKELAARRISGAIGMKVTPAEISFISEGDEPWWLVALADGRAFSLLSGNAVYAGGGIYWRNAKRFDSYEAFVGEEIPDAS